jgi:glycosyltransferase involved in cell wall biosynthesis
MQHAKYNILHISTFDNGGAWIATKRLHSALKKRGHNSKIITKLKGINDNDVFQYNHSLFEKIKESIRFRLKNKLRKQKILSDYNFFNETEQSTLYKTSKIFSSVTFKPDVIVAHWVSQFLNSKNISEISNKFKIPIVWYALDMAPITGGCHYAWTCKGYEKDCYECPALSNTTHIDLASKNLVFKKKYLSDSNLTIVASTPWLHNQVLKSSIFKNTNSKCILIGIDENIFKPNPQKHELKKKMNFAPDKTIALIGASKLADNRKGLSNIVSALKMLTDREKGKLQVILFGELNKVTEDELKKININFLSIGVSMNEQSLAEIYQASDFFISASLEDSGPMMINEAVMSGLPVVSFEMGIAPTLIKHKDNGYLAELGNNNILSHGIKYILNLNETELKQMSISSREIGLKNLKQVVQAEKFESIFKEITTRK